MLDLPNGVSVCVYEGLCVCISLREEGIYWQGIIQGLMELENTSSFTGLCYILVTLWAHKLCCLLSLPLLSENIPESKSFNQVLKSCYFNEKCCK